ncbi:hypothetical protein ACFFGV_10215 [Pontibacillus salicampi]|uniref:Uncharacterized protein n=1 Tax=Pontibacillus salicampi TaxID=1449801 RepID=A0ABV6LND6_9BACI
MGWMASNEIKEPRRAKRIDVDLSQGEDRRPLVAGIWSWIKQSGRAPL